MIPTKIYGAIDIIADVNTYGSGTQQRVVHNDKLERWVSGAENAINQLSDNAHNQYRELVDLKNKLSKYDPWMDGASAFLKFVAGNYPHILIEFNMVEQAKMKVADVKDTYTVVSPTMEPK
jgi:hypothetical protein